MAIYHCNCKIISRGQGRSAVGAAAYRSGEKITNEYDGITHDYTKKSGVVYAEIMLPEHAPQEWQDRSTLWNEVERIEKGSRAQLAREYEVALPREISREEQIQLVRDFVQENFVNKGMCADIAVHDKEDGNPHVHILLTTRPIEQDGIWGKKAENTYVLDKDGNRILQKIDKQNRKIYKRIKKPTTDWDSKEFLQRNRESWAAAVNRELERKNLPQRVDHRSLADQQKEQIPTEHIGVAAKSMEKRGEVSDRGERYREIQKANRQLEQIRKAESAAEIERKIQEILDRVERIDSEVIHDIVNDTEKKIDEQPKATRQQMEVIKTQIKENLDSISFVVKNKLFSYEQIQTAVSDLWEKYNFCMLELDKVRQFASTGIESAKQKMESLSQQFTTVKAAIADYQKCGRVLQRIDHDNGGRRAQTFRRIDTLMKEQGRTIKPAQPRTESQAVERLKSKMETMQGQSQQTRQGEAAPLIGGRASETEQGAYGRLQEKSEAVKEKMQGGSQPKPEPAAPGAKRVDFSFTALLDAQKEAFAECAALHDTRRPASPAVLARPQELRDAVAGLEAARYRMDAITMPPKPSLFASREVKDKYEQECRKKQTQRRAAEADCVAQFEKVVSFGVSRYVYDRTTSYSAEIKPPHISAEELKQLKDYAAVKLKELEQGAEQERRGAKPADAPTTTPERHRAAIERYRAALREIPAEYQQEARKALTDALRGYQSRNGRGSDLASQQEIGAVMRRELPASQEQEQTRARTVKRSKSSHEDR